MASGPSNIWNIGFPCDEDHEQQIDNSATILEKIAGLYAERLLNDITLEVGGKSLGETKDDIIKKLRINYLI